MLNLLHILLLHTIPETKRYTNTDVLNVPSLFLLLTASSPSSIQMASD